MRYTSPIRKFSVEFITHGLLEAAGSFTFKKQYARRIPVPIHSARKAILKLLKEKKIVDDYDLKHYEWFLVKYGQHGMLFNVQDFK